LDKIKSRKRSGIERRNQNFILDLRHFEALQFFYTHLKPGLSSSLTWSRLRHSTWSTYGIYWASDGTNMSVTQTSYDLISYRSLPISRSHRCYY